MSMIRTIKQVTGLERFENWRSKWSNPDAVDVRSYIGFMCDPEDSLLFCTLLFPDLREVQGAVVINSQHDEDNFNAWMEKFNGDVGRVEKIVNMINLYDVFSHCERNVSDEIYSQLSEVIALSWRLMLKEKFESKQIIVETSFTDQDYGPIVTFYQS